ncbi:hypothetical protein WPS_03640 [Vulcanimicrobium alpinum]|uniref:HTH crp-type domain-containing protein n=1 Tax=Vulcanimicrobium alpinum TaxID=3016050 RepID=A0AAN1XSQ5_UNVUL|nr:hypothetical protein WPS_03640 [Vulcanimicrobium alpinum]
MASGNRFLDALPTADAAALTATATTIELALGVNVAQRDEALTTVYFPLTGAISEIEEQDDGGAAEVTVTGPEGFSPLEAALGAPREQRRRLVQVPTHALAVSAGHLAETVRESPAMQALVNRYTIAMLRSAGISVACNARHAAPARLARWLLRMHDRVGSDRFRLTHEATALMLAVRRPTVTLAVNELVAAGAIESERGGVRILDRAKLETITCSCYAEARNVTEGVYPSP